MCLKIYFANDGDILDLLDVCFSNQEGMITIIFPTSTQLNDYKLYGRNGVFMLRGFGLFGLFIFL